MTRSTDCIYRVEAVCHADWGDKRRCRYPEFRVTSQTLGYYQTLEQAEAALQERASDPKQQWRSHYCFFVYELPVGYIPFSWEGAQRTRSYRADGRFFSETNVSEVATDYFELEVFRGRPAASCRFQPGDLVEVYTGRSVVLEVVVGLPKSPEEVQAHEKRFKELIRELHATDPEEFPDADVPFQFCYLYDAYTTLDRSAKCPQTIVSRHRPRYVCVFPPSRHIPEQTRNRLNRLYQQYKAHIAENLPEQP